MIFISSRNNGGGRAEREMGDETALCDIELMRSKARWKPGQGVQNVQQQLQQQYYYVIDFRLAKKLSKYLDLLCVVKEVHVPPSNTRKMSAFFMKVHTRLLQYLG